MSENQIHVAFDRVIKKVGPKDQATKSNEEIIIIGPSGEVVSKKPIWASAKNYTYYLVSKRNLIECQGFNYRLKEADTQRKIEFEVSYELSCPDDGSKALALALHGKDHPQKIFNRLWGDWTRTFFRRKKKENIDVIERFYELLPDLKRYVREQAKDKCGLDVDIFYAPKGHETVKNHHIQSKEFAIRVKDFSEELTISFETELEVIDGREMKAILKSAELASVEKLFISETKKWFLKNVSLQQYQFELHTSVRNSLIQALDTVILTYGRKIAYFHFPTFTRHEPDETQVVEWAGSIRIKDYEKPIEVKSNLLVSLEDYGLFMNSNVEDLQTWANKELQKVIQRALFDQTYLDIIVKLDEHKVNIENQLQASARKIGYSLQQLLVLPQIRALSLVDIFTINIERDFVTQDSSVSLKLKTIIHGRIKSKDLAEESLKEYLNPSVDLKRTIEASIDRKLEQAIYKIHPEQIYLYFRDAYDGEKSVESTLKDTVKSILRRFFVSDISITISPEENHIVRRLRNLIGQFRQLTFEIAPFNHKGNGELIPAILEYRVAGIDKGGWSVFMRNRFADSQTNEEMDKISRILQQDLLKKLNTVPAEFLQYNDYSTLQKMEEKLIHSSIPVIIKHFGLVIEIISYQREHTVYEKERFKVLTAKRIDSLHNEQLIHSASNEEKRTRLNILFDRRNSLLGQGIGKGDLEYDEITQELEELERKTVSEDPGPMHPKLIEERPAEFSFDQYIGDTSRQLSGKKEENSDPKPDERLEEEIESNVDIEI